MHTRITSQKKSILFLFNLRRFWAPSKHQKILEKAKPLFSWSQQQDPWHGTGKRFSASEEPDVRPEVSAPTPIASWDSSKDESLWRPLCGSLLPPGKAELPVPELNLTVPPPTLNSSQGIPQTVEGEREFLQHGMLPLVGMTGWDLSVQG